MKNEYNSYFFKEFHLKKGAGNYMDAEMWIPFFEKVAKRIIDVFNPTTVLDAGCACGYLVAALRDLGVEAYGFDISKYAINNVREDVAEYCFVHSITEPLPATVPQTFDLIVTTEVLEHLFPKEGEKAIENMCQYSDTIIFSSTPSDTEDRTHVNVQLPEYWAELFYNNSFAKNFVCDLEILSPWCVVYERFSDIKKLIFNYELNMRIDRTINEKNLTNTINELMESLLNVTSKFYFDDGNGFSEETALIYPQKLEDSAMVIDVPLPENTQRVRFHPVEDQYCMMKNLEFFADNHQTTDYVCNGEIINTYVLFNNLDPHFCIDNLQGKKILKIVARFQHVEEEFLQLYTRKNLVADTTIAGLNNEIAEARNQAESAQKEMAEKQNLFDEKDAIILEKTTAVAEKNAIIAKKEATIAEKDDALSQKDTALLEQTALLTEKEKQLAEKETIASDSMSALAEKSEELRTLEESMAEKDALIAEKDAALEEKEKELEEALENAKTSQKSQDSQDEPEDVDVDTEDEQPEESIPQAPAVDPEEITRLNDTIAELEDKSSKLEEEMVEKNLHIRKLEGQLKQLYEDYQIETKENKKLTDEMNDLKDHLESIKTSSVWKMVAPFYKDEEDDDKKDKKSSKDKKEKGSKDKKEKGGKKEKATKDKKEKPAKDKKEKPDKKAKNDKSKKEKPEKGKKAKPTKDKKGKKGKSDEEEPDDILDTNTTVETTEDNSEE